MNLDLRCIWLGFAFVVVPAFSFLTAHAHPEAFATKQQDILTLEPGKSIDREIGAGEAHVYAVTLTAGQYARVEVQQRGIWIRIALLTPSGETISEYVALSSVNGKQNLCLVAAQTGRYFVRVRPVHRNISPAGYAIQTSHLREATTDDQERFAAQKIYAQPPVNLYPRVTTPEAIQNALRQLESALLISQKIKDQELEAMLLRESGWRYSFDLNNEPEAIKRFARAAQLGQLLGHKREQALNLSALGYSHYMLGKMPQAREHYEQSRSLFHEIGDRFNEGIDLFRLGESYARESLQKTIQYYLQAEPLLRGFGGETEPSFLLDMALAWVLLGEPQNAFEASRKALALAEQLPNRGIKANVLINLSRAHQSIGAYQQALDASHEALTIAKSVAYREAEARAGYTLATQYLELGDVRRAVDLYQQYFELYKQLGYEARGLRFQSDLPLAYCQLGQFEKARDYALSLLPLTHKYQDRLSEGRTLTGLGRAYQALGANSKSVECFAQAATIFREMQFPSGEAQAILDGGEAQSAQRNFPQALTLYQQSLALAQKLNHPLIEAKSLTGIARVEQGLGHTAEARSNFEAALKIIESVRSRIVSPALRATFQATARDAYEAYVALLMQLHRQQPTAGYNHRGTTNS